MSKKEPPIEGGYTTKALREAIFIEADTMDDLKEIVKEAIRCHFEENDNYFSHSAIH